MTESNELFYLTKELHKMTEKNYLLLNEQNQLIKTQIELQRTTNGYLFDIAKKLDNVDVGTENVGLDVEKILQLLTQKVQGE